MLVLMISCWCTTGIIKINMCDEIHIDKKSRVSLNSREEKSAKKLVAKIILKWKSEDNCGVSRYKASCSVYIKVGRSLVVSWLHSLFGETWSWCVAQRKLSLCKVMLEVLWMKRIVMAVPFHHTYQQLLELPQTVFFKRKKDSKAIAI